MKVLDANIQHEGTFGGETIKMQIDQNSLDFIMHTLSNIYSDAELAVIRELSVNARDSHIAAGQTRPIEVTTPNWMSPFFKVKDYGVGLSKDDIRGLYCLAGETRVLTNKGYVEIQTLVGDDEVLMYAQDPFSRRGAGRWAKPDVIFNAGPQKLQKITLTKNRVEKVVFATAEHKWYARDYIRDANKMKDWEAKQTSDLSPGMELADVRMYNHALQGSRVSPEGIRAGMVFGDGSKSRSHAFVDLHQEKKELIKYFDGYGVRHTVDEKRNRDYLQVYPMPFYFKDTPSLTESKSYLLGWLMGYIATDGCVSDRGQISISSASASNVELFRNVCALVGIESYSREPRTAFNTLVGREETVHTAAISSYEVSSDFFLRSRHKQNWENHCGDGRKLRKTKWRVKSVEETDRYEDVFCAEINPEHAFALEDQLLTGNCLYGASTKRNTNEQTGSLGIGSKSPFAVTDQFTVISVKDGIKLSVVVSRSTTGGGQMVPVDESFTSEPNGVEIVVPMSAAGGFDNKVRDFFKFWEPGLVLVNGSEPAHQDDLIEITPSIFIKKQEGYYPEDDYVIMGGIAYKTDKIIPRGTSYRNDRRRFSIQAHVPIGAVAFTPSREDLNYTQHTLDAIEKINEDFKAGIVKVIEDSIKDAATPEIAYREYLKWTKLVDNSFAVPAKYRDEEIPKFIKGTGAAANGSDKSTVEFDEIEVNLHNFYDRSNYSYESVIIKDLPKDKFTSYSKTKVKAWAENEGVKFGGLYFTNDPAIYESKWLPSDAKILSWDEVKKATRPAHLKRPIVKDAFPTPVSYGRWLSKPIDPAKTAVYYVQDSTSGSISVYDLHKRYDTTHQFFKIAPSRLDKFLKAAPTAITLKDFFDKEAAIWNAKLTDFDIAQIHGQVPGWIRYVIPESIEDPDLKAWAEGKIKDPTKSQNAIGWETTRQVFGSAGFHIPLPAVPDNPLDKYPLYHKMNTWQIDAFTVKELVTYFNAKYKENK